MGEAFRVDRWHGQGRPDGGHEWFTQQWRRPGLGNGVKWAGQEGMLGMGPEFRMRNLSSISEAKGEILQQGSILRAALYKEYCRNEEDGWWREKGTWRCTWAGD